MPLSPSVFFPWPKNARLKEQFLRQNCQSGTHGTTGSSGLPDTADLLQRERGEIALCVDKELTVGKSLDCAVRQPLRGNVVQHPALFFPDHEVSRALDLEEQLVRLRDRVIQYWGGVARLRRYQRVGVEFSVDHQHRNRYHGRRFGIPSPQEGLAYPHHALWRRSGWRTRWRRSPDATEVVVSHDRPPDHVLNPVLHRGLATSIDLRLDLWTPPVNHEAIARLESHGGSGLR